MDARDRALALLACQRGLLAPAALQAALARGGPGERVPDLLVRHGLLQPPAVAALVRELSASAFVCERRCVEVGFEQLAGLERLLCPRCGGALTIAPAAPRPSGAFASPVRPTGRVAAVPARADDLDRYVSEDLTESGPPPPATGSASWGAGTGASLSQGARPGSERSGGVRSHDGRRLGPYVLERELGRGSNGVVYLARRPGVDGPLALKVLRDALADEETIKRFELEAAVAQKLRHPGIIAVFDAGQEGETRYFVMEFCPGQTLKEVLQQGRMPAAEAVRVVHALASAMAVAHDAGVIHRDLKPANVVVEEGTGRPRVTDFGLARDRSLLRSMTRTGDVIGTPFYMAPEQLRGEKELDHRIDIYALGVLLYEALTGQRPFKAETFIQLVELVTQGELTPPSVLEPGVPRALEAVVMKAMARDPAARYRTCHELVADLERVQAGKRPRAPLPPRARDRDRRASRSPLVVGVAGALVLGLVVAMVVVARGPTTTTGGDGATATTGGQPRSKDLRTLRRELEEALAPHRSSAERAAALERLLPGAWDPGVKEQVTVELARARARLALQDLTRLSDAEAAAALARAREHARGQPAVEREVEVQAARRHARRGRFADAAAGLEGPAGDPGATGREARLLLGFVLEKLGRGDAARAAYASVDGEGAAREAARAAVARLDGDLPGAEAAAKRAVAHDEASLLARLELARVQIERGDVAAADLSIERARAAAPEEPEVAVLDGRLKLREGKPDSAALAAERALGLTSGAPDPDALLIRARIGLAAAPPRVDAAERDVDEVLALAPKHVEALLWRGALRFGRKDRVGAAADWRQAFAADRARCERLSAALPTDARDAFRADVGLKAPDAARPAQPTQPTRPEPPRPRPGRAADALVSTLSRVQEGSLRVPAAVEQRCAGFGDLVREDLLKAATAAARGQAWKEVGFPLRRVGPFAGSDAAVHLERARLLIARDRTAEGAQALDAAGAGGGHEVARLRAELALRAGDPGEALRRYEALAAADPVSPEGRGARVWIHLLRGEPAAARTAGEGQLLPSGRLGLALALEQAGEWELAAKELQAVFDGDGATDSRTVALSFVYVVRAAEDQLRELSQLVGQERALAQVVEHPLLRAYDQAFTSELAAEGLLAVDDPGALLLTVAGELLERARSQQQGRASTHVLRARHALLARRGRDEVLAEWRRARELSRGLPLPAVDTARFDERFGPTDVEALLPR